MLRRQRNYDIDMSVNKLKTNDDVISAVLFLALRTQTTCASNRSTTSGTSSRTTRREET